MLTAKIDYHMLGKALWEYQKRGYRYVEVPWAVPEEYIRATLPPQFPSLTMAVSDREYPDSLHPFSQSSHLVGSAEQGFLSLDLAPGAYVGVTPCFRIEPWTDLTRQNMFMKIELFVTEKGATVDRVMTDAAEVMSLFLPGGGLRTVVTDEGSDLMLGTLEVGSYGIRSFKDIVWVYGTGLALPRFSVATALDSVT